MGGRGASSSNKSTERKTKIKEVKLNLPEGLTKQQERRITSLYNEAIGVVHGQTKDNYEYKEFDVKNDGLLTFVSIEIGLKGDEGTAASILARDKAHLIIGKRGAMKHFITGKNGRGTRTKKTKFLYQAFYDYRF